MSLIGNRISQMRKNKKMTQQELAEKLNVSRSTISNWEVGRNYPDLDMIVLISDELDLSLDELLREDKEMVKDVSGKVRNNKIYKKLLIGIGILILLIVGLQIKWQMNETKYYANVSRWEREAVNSQFEGSYTLKKDNIEFSTFVPTRRSLILVGDKPWVFGKKGQHMVEVVSEKEILAIINNSHDSAVDFDAKVKINHKGELIDTKEMSAKKRAKATQYLKEHQEIYQELYQKTLKEWRHLVK